MKSHFVAVTALFLLFAFACVVPTWAQSTCPTGFRDVQIVNACDNELWLGQQVASVGGAPGSGQSAQKCLTNNDCSSYPNSYCNQGVMCLANSDCNNFQLTNNGCTSDSQCAAVLPGSTCLPGGAPQLCSGVCNSKTDNRCAVWSPSQDGNTTVGPNYCFANSQRQAVGSAYECLGGLCQYFEYYPGENTACTQSSQCTTGQTCNTLVGLCQYQVPCEATNPSSPNQVSCPSGYTCTNNTRNGQVPLCNLSTCSSCPSGWLCNNGCQLDPALIDYKAGTKQDLCMPGTAGSVIDPLTTVNQNTVLWGRGGCPNFETCSPVGATCSTYSDCCSGFCQGGTCQASHLGACLSGDCGGNAICSGGGASRGFTKIEFNLQAPTSSNAKPTDFYDVSLVDGFNVAAAFKPMNGANLPPASQCSQNSDCQTSTGQTCVIQNGVGTCTCAAGEPGDCPSPYLCDAKPGKNGMCSIDPYSCGTPGASGARTTTQGPPSWPAVAIEGCNWSLSQSNCPAELQAWQPILNSSGNEVTCTQQSDCSAYAGSSCEYAPDRLAGAPGVALFCSTYVGCMNPNNVCSNPSIYGSTGPYGNLGCTNNQIAIYNIKCLTKADCPAMQGGGNMSCGTAGAGVSTCANTCSENSQCPVGMLCTSGTCQDPVTLTDAAPYSDLYGTTGYSPYTCYTPAPTAYPQQCQGCMPWSDFGTLGRFPGNPLPKAQIVCPSSSAGNASNQNFFVAASPNGKSYASYASIYKAACPSAYSAQFDDPTSTFQCMQPANYVLTFCPKNAGSEFPAASKKKP